MKRIVVSVMVLVMLLASIGGCFVPVPVDRDGRGGRDGGHNKDRGHDRDRGPDRHDNRH